jgi:hypothetical protein
MGETPKPVEPETREIADVPSRATQAALDQAMDTTAAQLLPEQGFQLMAPAQLNGHGAIWLRKDSGYLFEGLSQLLKMVNSPRRRCLDCGDTREDHDDSECDFVLSPIYEHDAIELARHQIECWAAVRDYQLTKAGFRKLPQSGGRWVRGDGAVMDGPHAWQAMNDAASARYMRECIHCKRQPEVHPNMMCPYGRGTAYLSRLQVMLSEDQPHLHELLTERDKPLSRSERES